VRVDETVSNLGSATPFAQRNESTDAEHDGLRLQRTRRESGVVGRQACQRFASVSRGESGARAIERCHFCHQGALCLRLCRL
jgi:hypothetical protein